MPARRRTPRRRTLRHQLLLRITALVALLAAVLSLAAVMATQQSLLRSVDRQLEAAFIRQDRADQPNNPIGVPRLQLPPGQPAGTIVVDSRYGTVRGAVLTDTSLGLALLRVDVAKELLALPANGQPVTVSLPGYGSYRAKAVQSGSWVQVVALPLAELQQTLAELATVLVVLTLIALGIAVVVVRVVVRNALEPLTRLAATATQVSGLELSRGEVALPVRVAAADADPNTEVGRVGYALNHMLGNVEGALAARQASESKVRQFVADASHELRNPLAAIRGYAELTRRHRDDLPPDTAFAMTRVESEAERMSSLVEDLLLLARLDARPELDLEIVDVGELAVYAVSDAQAAAPAYDWGVDLPNEPVLAKADRHQLHQVVTNLLANARRHTPEGTVVTVGVRLSPDSVVVTVTDDGPGIPAEIKDRVFERFTRADTARTRSGRSQGSTGLGLAIVAAVMQAHGGTATVESRPGRTVFQLTLPAVAAGPHPGSSAASPTG